MRVTQGYPQGFDFANANISENSKPKTMCEYEYVEPFLFIENEKLSSLPCCLKNDNISNCD